VAGEPGLALFKTIFTEWVEACWFAERDAAERHLDTLLGLPADVVFAGSLSVLADLLAAFASAGVADVAAALADHLIITGPDPAREALIRDVVVAAGSDPAARGALLRRHSVEAVTGAALECASLFAQAMANRDGVVPSIILEDL
jgi:hypothetical protein